MINQKPPDGSAKPTLSDRAFLEYVSEYLESEGLDPWVTDRLRKLADKVAHVERTQPDGTEKQTEAKP